MGNATTGVNAVLRSLGLEPGDEILIANLAYGAVANAAAFVARERGAKVVRLELPFPVADPGLYVEAVDRAITPRQPQSQKTTRHRPLSPCGGGLGWGVVSKANAFDFGFLL